MSHTQRDPLRYILVGAGGHGALWCRSILPRLAQLGKATCIAAVDANKDRFKFAQDYLGLRPDDCFTNLMEALAARRGNFLINSTPTIHHEKVVDMALTFDLHILSEAPAADTVESAVRTYRKMKAAKKRMAVVSALRYEQDKQTLAEFLKGPQFGRLNYIVSRFTANFSKSPAFGKSRHEMFNPLLVEAGSMHFDILRLLTRSDIKSVFAHSWNPHWGEYKGDSCAHVLLQMKSGAHCVYEGAVTNASTLSGWGNEYIRAECEKATLELDRRSIRAITGGAINEPVVEYLPMAEQDAWGAPWLAELFCDWLRGGPEPPNTLKDHMHVMAATFAAIESANIGKAIDVDDYLKTHLKRIPKGSVNVGVVEPPRPADSRQSSSALDLLLEDPLEDILGR
jgi:predicted dehydrogenase